MISVSKESRKHHKPKAADKKRSLPAEYRDLATFVDLANLAHPAVVARVRAADEAIAKVRAALRDARLAGSLDADLEQILLGEHDEADQAKAAELRVLFNKALERFPHPQGW